MKSSSRYYAWQFGALWSYSSEDFERLLDHAVKSQAFDLDDSVWNGRRVGKEHAWRVDGIFLVPAKYAFRSIVMPCDYFPEQFEVILREFRETGEVRTWMPLDRVMLIRLAPKTKEQNERNP